MRQVSEPSDQEQRSPVASGGALIETISPLEEGPLPDGEEAEPVSSARSVQQTSAVESDPETHENESLLGSAPPKAPAAFDSDSTSRQPVMQRVSPQRDDEPPFVLGVVDSVPEVEIFPTILAVIPPPEVPIEEPTPALPIDIEFPLTTASDILDKQYRLYTWCEHKTQGLNMSNSVLFAAVGFLYKECLRDALAMVMLGIGTVFLGTSLIICLVHVIPKISSGKTAGPNTRSLRGIGLYDDFDAYYKAFMEATKASMLTDTLSQIYGMAHNNLRSYKIIKRGVVLTFCGVVAIVGAICSAALAARGHHAFGSWQTEITPSSSTQAAAPTPTAAQQLSSKPAVPSITSPAATAGAQPVIGQPKKGKLKNTP